RRSNLRSSSKAGGSAAASSPHSANGTSVEDADVPPFAGMTTTGLGGGGSGNAQRWIQSLVRQASSGLPAAAKAGISGGGEGGGGWTAIGGGGTGPEGMIWTGCWRGAGAAAASAGGGGGSSSVISAPVHDDRDYAVDGDEFSSRDDGDELRTLLPLFTDLVTLTNTIVSAQESGDSARVDAATSRLCERVMRDERAIGILSEAMTEMNNGVTGKNDAAFVGAINAGNFIASLLSNRDGGSGGGEEGGGGSGRFGNIWRGLGEARGGMSATLGGVNLLQNVDSGGKWIGNMSKAELEQRVVSIQAAQNEVMQKLATMGVPTMQAWQQQQQQSQSKHSSRQNQSYGKKGCGGGGGSTTNSGINNNCINAPVFSMFFGGTGSAASNANVIFPTCGDSDTPSFISPWGSAVPPIIPPPGGWPPNAAAAIAGFATSIGDVIMPTVTRSHGESEHCDLGASIPIQAFGGDGGGGEDAAMANPAAWLDYYDACLRARGVKGGLAEFEEFARLTGQGIESFDPSCAGGDTMVNSSSVEMCRRRGMAQDRQISNDRDGDDPLSAEFEYEDVTTYVKDYGLSDEDCQVLEAEVEEEVQRLKKAAKKRDKKARQKERAKKEAEMKAAVALMKKRDKTITSWRSRVVTACMGGDAKKMDALVGESPFKNFVYNPTPFINLDHKNENGKNDDDIPKSQEEYLLKQMVWFFSNCLQKYQAQASSETTLQPFANNLAREKLAKYILSVSFDAILFQSEFTQNRNAIHSAAYRNDANFVKWIIGCQHSNKVNDVSMLEYLCRDGGWSPLHYATAGAATEVVELLLRQGVCVTTRTDRSLTCFTRQGSGITARELAIVLQSGAVDDEILSEADILDDVVENRIENVSSEVKAAYMRTLQSLATRFTNVENNGYSPPIDNVRLRDNIITMTDNGAGGNETSPSEVSLSTIQTSREKKKQHQQTNTKSSVSIAIATSSQPESKSTHSPTDDDDLNDPVAVALLGMGFAGAQIKSAARALGGFERATADDMVMWILGGGENVDSESAADQDNIATKNSTKIDLGREAEKVDPAILGKTQKNAAMRAKRDSEEAARKRLEEQAAAKRAAEKREEQRRIRREWNEREQARQELEKNARMVEALERRKQAEIEKSMPKTAILPAVSIAEASGGVGMPPSAVHIPINPGGAGCKHRHRNTDSNGPPLTIIAGGPKMPSSKSKAAASNMGIPQAPTLRAPKILTRPSSTPAGFLSCATGSVHSQQTTMSPGNLPLFAPSTTLSPTPATSPPRSILTKTCNQTTSQHPSIIHKRHHPPLAILQKTTITEGPSPNISSTSRIQHNAPAAFTVKSSAPLTQNQFLGTGGTLLAPPGFLSGSSPPEQFTTDSASTAYVETNPTGMIRATAREFVPTSFKLTVPHIASNNAASTSAQSMHAPNDHSYSLPSDHVPSMVSSFSDGRNATPASLVPIISTNGDYTVPSAASSITGVSCVPPTVVEENATSRVGSIMMFESIPSSVAAGAVDGIQTSSFLESFAFGVDSNSASALGSSGIWGGGNDANQTASLGLAGLNFSSFLGSGNSVNNMNQGVSGAGGSANWGPNTSRDSIW
ncbi:LOW QUALITY PROTEIN: hypothetical protein ACHAXA_009818, partial [Cyclostephanos tholiformis]